MTSKEEKKIFLTESTEEEEKKVVEDSVVYIPWAQIKEKYKYAKDGGPTKNVISSGSYGTVYDMGNYAMKQFFNDEDTSFFREIDIYARFDHPCLFKIVNFSINRAGYLYTLRKGESIVDAYKAKKITLRQIASDILSVLALLHSGGVAHCDVKPSNIVYYDGKAVLIDMGIADNCLKYESDTVFYGIAYTPGFRDPEVNTYGYNSVKCDLYALGRTLASIAQGQSHLVNDFQCYQTPSTTDKELNDFIAKSMISPVSDRPSAQELLKHTIIERKYEGYVLKTPVIKTQFCNAKILAILIDWIMILSNKYNPHARAVFMALHLIHRCLGIILPNYDQDTKARDKVQLLGMACLYLSMAIYGNQSITLDDFITASANAYKKEDLIVMLFDVVHCLRGIIYTPTYWDYAYSFEDLVNFNSYMGSCSYNPNYTPAIIDRKSNKNVHYKDVYSEWHKTEKEDVITLQSIKMSEKKESQIRPIQGPVPQDSFKAFNNRLNDMWLSIKAGLESYDAQNYIGWVYCNRAYLKDLSDNNGARIFKALAKTGCGRYILETYLGLSVEKLSKKADAGVNPFK